MTGINKLIFSDDELKLLYYGLSYYDGECGDEPVDDLQKKLKGMMSPEARRSL